MKTTTIIFIALVAAAQAGSETLALWNFDNHDDAWYDDDTVTVQELTATAEMSTAEVTHSNPQVLADGAYWNDTIGSTYWYESSLADAIAAGNYYSLTFETETGKLMNLDSLKLVLDVNGGGNYAIFTSVDGFSEGNEVSSGTISSSGVVEILDLSGAQYDSLSSLEVRVIAYGLDGNAWQRFTIGNIGTTDGVNDIELQGDIIAEAQQGSLFIIK